MVFRSNHEKITMDFISKLPTEENGVETVTHCKSDIDKSAQEEIFRELQICASVLSEIDCVQRAILFQKAGANVM